MLSEFPFLPPRVKAMEKVVEAAREYRNKCEARCPLTTGECPEQYCKAFDRALAEIDALEDKF